MAASDKPTIFISYSHEDEAWKKLVVTHLSVLAQEGRLAIWEDRHIAGGEDWAHAIEQGVEDCHAALLLISASFLTSRFLLEREVPKLLARRSREGIPVIPLILRPCVWTEVSWLNDMQVRPKDGKALCSMAESEAEQALADLAQEVAKLVPSRAETTGAIALSRLPRGREHLVGREEELGRLEEAFVDPGTHVVSIVAWGGVGKTALAVEWMTRLAQRDWPGVERYFDWSFYSQGTRDQGAASADTFIETALRHFGDPDPRAGSGWDRGERLARLVAQQPTVLVLDGVEPLQHPPGPMAGQLRDPVLRALLRGLAQRPYTGVCVVTTREPVADLAPFDGKTVQEWRLERLSDEAGVQLLRHARAAGTKAELRRACQEVGGHALALQLIGGYVALAHGGDIRKRDLFGFQEADAEIQGGHAFRVIAAYERWLEGSGSREISSSEAGPRELALLRLLALFDRPADGDCLAALRQEPVIKGLTEPLVGLSDAGWNTALRRLESIGLINLDSQQSGIRSPRSAIVDAHPLVREYFAGQLQQGRAEAWCAAQRRLYEHLTKTTPYQPDTLAGLQPLYQAVAHGCQAGLHREACGQVYRERILRGTGSDGFYSGRRVGAFGAELAAVTWFFEEPWKRVVRALSEADQAWLLGVAAFNLRALGRLAEALDPMRASVAGAARLEEWGDAARHASNLSELELTLGEVAAAARDAEQSIDFADRSGDAFLRIAFRTTLADALHQAGRRREAREQFHEAEAMQAKQQPERPLLCSLRGFLYCDFMLAEAERSAWQRMPSPDSGILTPKLGSVCPEVEQRVTKMFEWRLPSDPLLDSALDHLTLGRAQLYRAIVAGSSLDSCRALLDRAVDGLQAASRQDHLPRGLLSRAWVRFIEGDAHAARSDLDEAWEIAERGAMRLHMADILLHRARLFQDRESLYRAGKLIDDCGYGRRREELANAREAAKNWPDSRSRQHQESTRSGAQQAPQDESQAVSGRPTALTGREEPMPTHQFNAKRLAHLEELLDIEYEKLHEFEKGISLADGISQKIALRQQIRRELGPRLRSLEREYAELLADGVPTEEVPSAEAEGLIEEVRQAVVKAEETPPANAPQEMLQLLTEIREKLNEPGKSASAKLKVALPIIPLISSYELQMDIENVVTGVWRKTREFFKRLLSRHPR